MLRQAVAQNVASAATCWIWNDGRVVASVAAGRTMYEGGREVHPDTVFDVASVTKPLAAALAARLVAEGVAQPSQCIIPGDSVTLEQVLSHRAGFRSWLPLFERVERKMRGTPDAARQIIRWARSADRVGEAGTRTEYSDLGFICLIPWLQETAGATLQVAIEERVTGPAGMTSTRYRPPASLPPPQADRIPATERLDHRGGVIQGLVHDDNAFCMGGISTHAGLFSTAPDLGRFAVSVLTCRQRDGWLPASMARWFTSPVCPGARTPGWDVRSPEGSSAGKSFGINSFGHLGYTGCSVWVDPDLQLVAVLLTNRVHPSSENLLIRSFRPRFHDRVHALVIEDS